MTISIVLADANILFSRVLRDYFLYLAGEGAIEIRWSQQILDEMSSSTLGGVREAGHRPGEGSPLPFARFSAGLRGWGAGDRVDPPVRRLVRRP